MRAVIDCQSPYEVYRKLYERYDGHTLANRILLLTSWVLMKFRNGSIFEFYIAKLEGIFTQLSSMKQAMEERLKVTLLLVTLSKDKNYTAVVAL